MEKIKKAVWVCYIIQVGMFLILAGSKVLLASGVIAFSFLMWFVPVLLFINLQTCCNILILRAFKKTLHEVSPEIHAELFKDYPLENISIKVLRFTFEKIDGDSIRMKRLRTYMKNMYLIAAISFFEVAIALVILSL